MDTNNLKQLQPIALWHNKTRVLLYDCTDNPDEKLLVLPRNYSRPWNGGYYKRWRPGGPLTIAQALDRLVKHVRPKPS